MIVSFAKIRQELYLSLLRKAILKKNKFTNEKYFNISNLIKYRRPRGVAKKIQETHFIVSSVLLVHQ